MIYFIGIGGIGVSALAQYYLEKGEKVSGSDLCPSQITELLEKKGAKIFIGKHKASNLKSQNPDLVIYSPAISPNNPELKFAKKLKIKCQSYPQALGELTKKYFTICVCGTHGKSTTTALISLILIKANFDPTVILGTKLKEFQNSNFRKGNSQYLVIEADENFASFLNYWPKIIVLTNLEPDHLDFYKNFKNYILAFKKFIFKLPKDGILIANKDDKNIFKILPQKKKIEFYSLSQPEAKKIKKILKIFGNFNVSNALASLSLARVFKIPDNLSFEVFSQYEGSWRRLETFNFKIDNLKGKLIIDYAHHPTEVELTLKAIKQKWKNKKIICIFQPHQYQRTYYLWDRFVKVFKEIHLEKIIITDIYEVPGRESKKIKEKVNSKKLVEKINKKEVIYLEKEKIIPYLKKNLKPKEILVLMGAGDIYNLKEKLKIC